VSHADIREKSIIPVARIDGTRPIVLLDAPICFRNICRNADSKRTGSASPQKNSAEDKPMVLRTK
jgi:hypothetical protein